MTILPVIEREMRTQSRLGFTYLLRVLGAAALMIMCVYIWSIGRIAPQGGGFLFGYLHIVLLVSIWILVPLSSADCISRERREGTLGLLFLTPLKAREIVLSKGMVHGLRALTLWLATAPILTICFLLGGVTWKEAVISVLVNFSSICLGLAAGVLASSSTKSWSRAMLLAGGLAACFCTGFIILAGWTLQSAVRHDPAFKSYTPVMLHQKMLEWGFYAATDIEGAWGQLFGRITKPTQHAWLVEDGEMAVACIILLLLAIQFAAWIVRRSWQEEPPSARSLWMEETFTRPIIGVNFFHRWLRRKLEHNPIGWLEQRTWSGRMVTWGWFAVMVSFYSAVFYVPNADGLLRALQGVMAWSLLLIICVSAAGSFQRERETRVLELLLVSPMTAAEIIWGRLRGLWGQFLPALVLMLLVWVYLTALLRDTSLIPFFCSGFLALPVIGLYYSLRRSNFINAFLSTLAVGLLLPQLAVPALDAISRLVFWGIGLQEMTNVLAGNLQSISASLAFPLFQFLNSPNFPAWLQAGIALYLGRKLHRDLVNRNFPFSKGAT